jgi:hypothetical protein
MRGCARFISTIGSGSEGLGRAVQEQAPEGRVEALAEEQAGPELQADPEEKGLVDLAQEEKRASDSDLGFREEHSRYWFAFDLQAGFKKGDSPQRRETED